MKLLEYQAKELFMKAGMPSSIGIVVDSTEGLEDKVKDMNFPVVVKAQVLIGGRGKAGGVKFAENPKEVLEHTKQILGMDIRGHEVERVMIVEKVEAKSEYYLSITLDREYKCPLIIFCSEGGVDIEETAKTAPEKILKIQIDPLVGIKDYMVRYMLSKSNMPNELFNQLFDLLNGLYKAFMDNDCMLTEVNPVFLTVDDKLIAGDGKVTVDDSALYRQPDVTKYEGTVKEAPLVAEAKEYNFLYIPIEKGGNISIMSNGSGLLMSLLDLISKEGMKVGAGLDMGGGATADRIKDAVRILLSSDEIEYLFINIFGGITRCDEVANGIKLAVEEYGVSKPIILRMDGTNKKEGLEIIKKIDADIIPVEGLRPGVKELIDRRA